MPSFQGVLSKLVVLGSQTPCNYGPKKSTSTDFLPMHSTMLSDSLGTRIIQKNKEKTSVPSCFALEAPMRSRARKTRKARLHVNGGVLIPQRGTFWFPRESEKCSPTNHRRKPARMPKNRCTPKFQKIFHRRPEGLSRASRALCALRAQVPPTFFLSRVPARLPSLLRA